MLPPGLREARGDQLQHRRRPARRGAGPRAHARLAQHSRDGRPLHPRRKAARGVQLSPPADRRQPVLGHLRLQPDQRPGAALRRALADGRHRRAGARHGRAARRAGRAGTLRRRGEAHHRREPARHRRGARRRRADRRGHRGVQRRRRLDLPQPRRAAASPPLDRRAHRPQQVLDEPVRLVFRHAAAVPRRAAPHDPPRPALPRAPGRHLPPPRAGRRFQPLPASAHRDRPGHGPARLRRLLRARAGAAPRQRHQLGRDRGGVSQEDRGAPRRDRDARIRTRDRDLPCHHAAGLPRPPARLQGRGVRLRAHPPAERVLPSASGRAPIRAPACPAS